MKKFFILTLMAAMVVAASAQTKKVSILGDSYSTFQGIIPANYSTFYPNNQNDVKEVEQTWWSLYIKAKGYELEKNDSWSGTTICGTGYGRMDSSRSNFISRVDSLGNPDIILICGATNDSWAGVKMGEYQYGDWRRADLYYFRPAMAKMLNDIRLYYPNVDVYFILNSQLKDDINNSVVEVCRHYDVPVIKLKDIDKKSGHPSIKGMKSFAEQVLKAIK